MGRAKDENLDPIKSCGIPQSITQLKALLGATQQMAQYLPYYALVAAPLHKLTRKDQSFPIGSKWILGSDYDIAYHHVISMILDKPQKYTLVGQDETCPILVPPLLA